MPDYAFGSLAGLRVIPPWYEARSRIRYSDENVYERAKRVLDLALCFAALPLVLLLLGICALAIKLDSPGPAFFTQPHTGQGGRRFKMWKLRTMEEAEAFKMKDTRPNQLHPSNLPNVGSPQITRLGHVLLKTRLDELPQILNVLRGEMSFVGPRPTPLGPETYRLWHTARLEVKPGITGLWQISDRSYQSFDDCSRLDIMYIRNRTLVLDAKILFRTISLIVRSGRPFVKRAFDIAISITLLLILAPVMLVVAVVVRWTSPGPALFRQVRVGKDGYPFKILKFRTMRGDAEAVLAADPVLHATYVANDYKLPPEIDPRITPVGRWLRKTSLDELPQLLNVLRGEMSLVGPRPIVPDEIVHYGSQAAKFCSVPPGLTGAWQVLGRSNLHYPERCSVELEYVQQWSLSQDLVILFRTVGVVLSGRGAT